MPPRAWVDYIVFVIDCSKNTDAYLQTLYKIIARKYFGKAKSNRDVYRVIFLNNPNSKAVSVITDWLLYNLVELKDIKSELDKVGTPSDHESIVEALSTAVDCFRDEIHGPATKKIVFMTDLTAPLTNKAGVKQQIEQIRSELVSLDIWLYVIGPKVHVPVIFNESDVLKMRENVRPVGEISAEQKQNFEILRKIYRHVNGVVIDLENGLDLVFSLRPAVKAPYPWCVDLSIGSDIKIPIVCYRSTRDYEKTKFEPVSYSQEQKLIDKEKSWHDVHSHEEVPDSDVASGYSYHGKIVMLTEKQDEKFSADTHKCLSIVAFVDQDAIKKELYLLGHTMNVLVPDKSAESDKGLRLLIQVMQHRKVVALAKRVYGNRYNPLLYCIFPCPEHKAGCLLMSKLPYSHEFLCTYRPGQRAKLDRDEPSLKANMYGFLDSMTATSDVHGAGETLNPLPEYMKHNPSRLYKYEYLAMKNLGLEPRSQPEVAPDPLLLARSEEYAVGLIEYLEQATKS